MIAEGCFNLSVIIPVYNAEQYLAECIDSLLAAEGIQDAEIILVDDGSSDGSGRIADEYASANDNITVIHKQNGGSSEARNFGLEHASGKYVFFCDADDTVKPDLFTAAIKAAGNSDSDVILWDGDTAGSKERNYFTHNALNPEETLTGKEALCRQLKSTGDFPTVIWLGAYRRSFLLDDDLLFKCGLHHEDDLWVPQMMLAAQSVIYMPERLYMYRIHRESLSRPSEDEIPVYIESLLEIFSFLFSFSDDALSGDPSKAAVDAWLTRKYLHWIYKYDFYHYGYGDKIDKSRLWKTSGRFRDKIRVLFLYIRG